MPLKQALSGFAMLLCVIAAAPAQPQGFDDRPKTQKRFDPASVYPAHQLGGDVALPALEELRVVGQSGEMLVLAYHKTIPSQRKALSSVQILYRYKVGDKSARVIRRRISTRFYNFIPIGPGGVTAIHDGWELIPSSGRRSTQYSGFGTLREYFKGNKRELMRDLNATPRGILYQETLKIEGQSAFGPIYYAPRNKLTYQIEQEVLIAEAGFAEIGLQNQFQPGFRQGERYAVLFNKNQTKASVLDVESLDRRVFDIVAPRGSEKWHVSSTLMDDRYLYAQHGLYDLKTGERVAVRSEDPGKTHPYHRPALMHNRVSYGITRTIERDKNGAIKGSRYTLWARPVFDDGSRQQTLATYEQSPIMGTPLAGENGLIYTDGKKWVKIDWLKPEDFEKAQAE